MPFNRLVLGCLVFDKKLKENQRIISFAPPKGTKSGEGAVFFSLDDAPIPQQGLRVKWNHKGLLCDGLVLYRHGNEVVLCLLELKGTDLSHAVDQVLVTHKLLKDKVAKEAGKQKIVWKAAIVHGGKCPSKVQAALMKELKSVFGKSGKGFVSKTVQYELSPLLRA